MQRKIIDITGQRFGRLTVTGRAPNTKAGQARWNCKCDCGAETTVISQSVRGGKTVSCGCHKAERARAMFLKHGESHRSPEYRAWANMVSRCEAPCEKDAAHYAARGITVCERWRHDFPAFLADMGRRPSPKHSLDRIDVNGGYGPENCRWATPEVQANNKRNNHRVAYHGNEMTFADAWEASAKVVTRSVAYSRVRRGWPAEAAIDTPTIPVTGRRDPGSRHYATTR